MTSETTFEKLSDRIMVCKSSSAMMVPQGGWTYKYTQTGSTWDDGGYDRQ